MATRLLVDRASAQQEKKPAVPKQVIFKVLEGPVRTKVVTDGQSTDSAVNLSPGPEIVADIQEVLNSATYRKEIWAVFEYGEQKVGLSWDNLQRLEDSIDKVDIVERIFNP